MTRSVGFWICAEAIVRRDLLVFHVGIWGLGSEDVVSGASLVGRVEEQL